MAILRAYRLRQVEAVQDMARRGGERLVSVQDDRCRHRSLVRRVDLFKEHAGAAFL